MNKHEMELIEKHFTLMLEGKKVGEFCLYDEKREQIKIGDAETCGNCKFSVDDNTFTECRKNPPLPIESSEVLRPGQKRGFFPNVDNGDWCGEYKQKEQSSGLPETPGYEEVPLCG